MLHEERAMAGETILHIGYDPELLELRNGVLQRGEYLVLSLLGNEAVRESAKSIKADLIVIGSGGTYEERVEIAQWLSDNIHDTRVLVMCASPDESYPPGIFHFYGDTPRDLLIAVDSMLHTPRRELKT